FKKDEAGKEPWRLCSVCAKLPGAFIAAGRETDDGVDEVYERFAEFAGADWEALTALFKPGERLCPYCLFKRLAATSRAFNKVAKKLIGYEPERKVSFPATDDIAALATRLALLRSVKEVDDLEPFVGMYEEAKKFGSSFELRKDAFEKCRDLENDCNVEDALKALLNRWWTPYLLYLEIEKALNECENGADHEKRLNCEKRLLAVLATIDVPFYNIYPRIKGRIQKIAEKIKEKEESEGEKKAVLRAVRSALESPRTYVALLRFDADNGGFTKLGVISRDGRRLRKREDVMSNLEYVVSLLEGMELKALDEGQIGGFSELKDSMLDEVKGGRTREPTPAYLSALSAAMSYTIMRTVGLVTSLGGVVIYAAGDEGLVMLPGWLPKELVEDALERYEAGTGYELSSNQGLNASALVRRIWWSSSSFYPGFHPVREFRKGDETYARIPAVLAGGLSEGLRFLHYKDHLHAEIESAEELLEYAKELGDALAAGFGRGAPSEPAKLAKERIARLRLANGNSSPAEVSSAAEEVLKASNLLRLIERGKVSSSITKSLFNTLGSELWEFLKGKDDEAVRLGLVKKLVNTYSVKNERIRELVEELLEGKKLNEIEEFLKLVEMARLAER
ncbi:MAG: hypothetical protein GXO07_02270, partial [Crenarchaeota archaeon]|nr:hypothetical protein [Thermoproteota archaeon]